MQFKDLRENNVKRSETSFYAVDSWSPTDWATALAGEVGELCNLIKKMRRGDAIPLQSVSDEIADVAIYLDLLAARLGINLEEAVVKKFNEVSEKIGSTYTLS
jgi:NTP pyrophosphatase (non-canonical NTP hydrolase)